MKHNMRWSSSIACLIVLSWCSDSAAQECLHGSNESPAERERREYALRVAGEIYRLQAAWIAAAPGRGYARPSQLKLPTMPNDFGLTFWVDGRRYLFTLKDDKDPCLFAIFSEHDGLIYAAMPQPEPVIKSAPEPSTTDAR